MRNLRLANNGEFIGVICVGMNGCSGDLRMDDDSAAWLPLNCSARIDNAGDCDVFCCNVDADADGGAADCGTPDAADPAENVDVCWTRSFDSVGLDISLTAGNVDDDDGGAAAAANIDTSVSGAIVNVLGWDDVTAAAAVAFENWPKLLSPLLDVDRLRLDCEFFRFAEPLASLIWPLARFGNFLADIGDELALDGCGKGGNVTGGAPNKQSLIKPQAQIVDVGALISLCANNSKSCGSCLMVISVLDRTLFSDTMYRCSVPFSMLCTSSAFGRHERRTKRASLPYVRVSTQISGPSFGRR